MSVRTSSDRRLRAAIEALESRTLLTADVLTVVGNQIMDPHGNAVRLTGVNVPSLEWGWNGEGPSGGGITATVTESFNNWEANIIRLPVNQDNWLNTGTNGTNYRAKVDSIVAQAAAVDKYVLLDLHSGSNIGNAPDDASTTFWLDAATRYANNPSVLFGLYNEPHGISWDVWKYGGDNVANTGLHSPGLQSLLNTVRSTGAKNIAVVGGLDWAYQLGAMLEGFQLSDATGNGVVYDTHIYPWKSNWQGNVGNAAQEVPIIVGEIGHPDGTTYPGIPTSFEDDVTWMPRIMDFMDLHNLNYTAWAMYPDTNGSFPSLISDWTYTPTTYFGTYVKNRLTNYDNPATLQVLGGTVIGTTGFANNPTVGTLTNTDWGAVTAFDTSTGKFFNAPTPSGGWTGLDLGTPAQVAQISFRPRDGNPARMLGGKFQASNTPDFSSGVVDLYTVTATPADLAYTTVNVSVTAPFRYVRYIGPDNSWSNVADIKFLGYERPVTATILSQGKPVTYSLQTTGYEASKAVDGVITSGRWQANSGLYPQWITVDLGSNQAISQVVTYMLQSATAGYGYKVETSTDNTNWTMFADRVGNTTAAPYYVDYGSAFARYVRLTVTSTVNTAQKANAQEFQVYGTPLISLGATATASSQATNAEPYRALDRNASTRWQSAVNTKPQWLQVDLGSVHNVSQVQTSFLSGGTSYYRYKIEVSKDGTTWQEFADRTANTALANPNIDAGSGIGRYVRVTVTGTQNSGTSPNIVEVEVFGSKHVVADLISQRKTMTASSNLAGYEPWRATDGSTTTRWQAANATKPQWLQIDLGANHAVRKSHLYVAGAATSSYQYKIEYRWDPLESTCRHASLSIL